ncbi:G10 protein [Gorgonomyces haynaldii]|nr:G10 protein [Gorgonomyces haynaldii]
MPKVRRGNKPPPEGWEIVEPTLMELGRKMREAETENTDNKRKTEITWNIFRFHHQRSRYCYEMYYKRKAISKEVYDYCVKEGYADQALIAKWRKTGYEKLCCLRCIQPKDTNFGTTCICRVPQSQLKGDKVVECVLCGCRGCASGG